MKFSKYLAFYNLMTGISMFAIWTVLLATDQVPEVKTQPIDIIYHLMAEGVCALVLLISGLEILKQSERGKDLSYLGWGMLLYSVLTNVAYYIDLGDFIMVSIFTLLQIVTIGLIGITLLISPAKIDLVDPSQIWG